MLKAWWYECWMFAVLFLDEDTATISDITLAPRILQEEILLAALFDLVLKYGWCWKSEINSKIAGTTQEVRLFIKEVEEFLSPQVLPDPEYFYHTVSLTVRPQLFTWRAGKYCGSSFFGSTGEGGGESGTYSSSVGAFEIGLSSSSSSSSSSSISSSSSSSTLSSESWSNFDSVTNKFSIRKNKSPAPGPIKCYTLSHGEGTGLAFTHLEMVSILPFFIAVLFLFSNFS